MVFNTCGYTKLLDSGQWLSNVFNKATGIWWLIVSSVCLAKR